MTEFARGGIVSGNKEPLVRLGDGCDYYIPNRMLRKLQRETLDKINQGGVEYEVAVETDGSKEDV